MKQFALLLFGLAMTIGMIGCAKEETKPAEPAAPAETAPAETTPDETPAETPAE